MQKTKNYKLQTQRGVSLFIAFMIMTTLLGIALGTSSLLFSQIGILKGIGHSVLAFYALEAGLERALFIDNTVCLEAADHAVCLVTEFTAIGAAPPGSVSLSNEASYQLTAEAKEQGGCPADANYCVKSVGTYEAAQRAVRVRR